MWIIQDWTGTRKFPGKTFQTFDDGWAFLYAEFPDGTDEDFGEWCVVPADDSHK